MGKFSMKEFIVRASRTGTGLRFGSTVTVRVEVTLQVRVASQGWVVQVPPYLVKHCPSPQGEATAIEGLRDGRCCSPRECAYVRVVCRRKEGRADVVQTLP